MSLKLVALLILLSAASAVTTLTANQGLCTCSQIQFQNDCQAASIPNTNTSLAPTTCTWTAIANATGTAAKGTCSTATTTTPTVTTIPTYCSTVSAAKCPSTNGCALPDAKTCVAFTGCSAYVFTTNSACQAVSTQCTTDGVQCAQTQACSTYSVANCGLYSSNSGTGTCKLVSGACQDQNCTDAPITLITDAQCSAFLAGCLTNGGGCVLTRASCTTYNGTSTTCAQFIGTEGQCKFSGSGTACMARTCSDAPTTLTTNAACIAYLSSCIYTTGKGCTSTTQTCQSLAFSSGCVGFMDSTTQTPCVVDNSVTPAVACRATICTDNTTATTNAACQAFLPSGNCVTNGMGCVNSSANQCSNYTGTTTTCSQYIGATGPCKGTSATAAACTPKACSDAPTTTNTNAACAAIQTGCVTNGYGCASSLTTLCSAITPTTSQPCDGAIGSDGPCTLITGQTSCTLRTCTLAGSSTISLTGTVTTTNAGCSAFNSICVTNGSTCITGGVCTSLAKTSCSGFSTCSWNSQCLSNTSCGGYSTQSQCISNTGASGRVCTWSSGTCVATICPTGTTFITDAACQNTAAGGYPGCYWNGATSSNGSSLTPGCVDINTASCGSVAGDNTFTSTGCPFLFNKQCTSSNIAVATIASCIPRTCLNFAQSTAGLTTTPICQAWLSTCVSNGNQGCANAADNCDSGNFYGTQSTCDSLRVGPNLQRCWSTSTTVIGTCRSKTANDIVTPANNSSPAVWSDAACQAQLSTAASSRAIVTGNSASGVCVILANTSCNSFTGTYSQCITYSGLALGNFCTKMMGFCYQKPASVCASMTSSSLSTCKATSYFCQWAGGTNCITSVACSLYTAAANINLTQTMCSTLVDTFGNPCGAPSSGFNGCQPVTYCFDYSTGNQAGAASTFCSALKDLFGNPCSATNGDTQCSYTSITPATAKFALGSAFCGANLYNNNGVCLTTALVCSGQSPATITMAACKSALAGCVFLGAGTSCAAVPASCTAYVISDSTVTNTATAATYCNALKNSSGKQCFFDQSTTYTSGTSTCLEPIACASYTAAQIGTIGLAICQAVSDTNGIACQNTGGSTCVSAGTCDSYTITGADDAAKALACQQLTDSVNKLPCYFVTGASTCAALLNSCASYAPLATSKEAQCKALVAVVSSGSTTTQTQCGIQASASSNCQNRSCNDYFSTAPADQATCQNYLSTCYFNGTSCASVPAINNCSSYAVSGGSAATICKSIKNSKGMPCDFVVGASYCSDRYCSNTITPTPANQADCRNYSPACTFASVASSKCVPVQDSCYKYTATSVGDCTQLSDAAGIACAAIITAGSWTGTQCTYQAACPTSGATAGGGQIFCNKINPLCVVNGDTCTLVTPGVCTSYTVSGSLSFTQALAYCQNLKNNINGKPCYFTNYQLASTATNTPVQSTTCSETVDSTHLPNCVSANASNNGSTPGTGSETDCQAFNPGCTASFSANTVPSTQSTCHTSACSLNTTATTNAACNAFYLGCLTLTPGAVGCTSPSTPCSGYLGTTTTCLNYVGNGIPCYQATSSATTTAVACSPKTCTAAPTTANTNAACDLWYPSTGTPNQNCVWNGTTTGGCVSPQLCSAFTGTITTCLTFIATNGPCKGTNGTTAAACAQIVCTDAPNTYTTDAQCATYANSTLQCITNGYGCISRSSATCSTYQNSNSCNNSLLQSSGSTFINSCSWVGNCITSVQSCSSLTSSGASTCLTTPVVNGSITTNCAWDNLNNVCRNQTCADLPASLTTNSACSALISTCTTTGAGCVTLGTCASYSSYGPTACAAATNQELANSPQITKCMWDTTLPTASACRVIRCTDNTTATTNLACNVNGLTTCVTTGAGCVTIGAFTCGSLTTAAACLVDGTGSPCLWIRGTCTPFTSCTSIAWTTHASCQQIIVNASFAPTCTSNGATCVALNSCANYQSNASSCVASNIKGTCGLLPANSAGNTSPKCQIFGACTDALGTTNAACQLYSPKCISNGVSCILPSTCGSYTQFACNSNAGTDGACVWQQATQTNATPTCRQAICSDATTANNPLGITTDIACAAFAGPFINTCTTNGTGCVSRQTCATYTTQLGCVTGTDGTCFWVASTSTSSTTSTTGSCRLMTCADNLLPSNTACATAFVSPPATTTASGTTNAKYVSCVSNGSNCIPISTCSSYTRQIACQGSGTDGICAFTSANSTTPTIGTCVLVTSCASIGSDAVACNKFPDRCYYQSTVSGTTTTGTCVPHTCTTYNSGVCKPVPSFNYATYSICVPASSTNSTCINGDGSALVSQTCFTGGLGQYTWNDTSAQCQYCGTATTNQTNTTNTSTTATTSGLQVTFLIYGALLALY